MSYGYNALCGDCNQIESTERVHLVPDLACNNASASNEAMALWIDPWKRMYSWRFSLSRRSQTTSATRQEFTTLDCEIVDFVKLRGPTFYAIDSATCVYVLDCGGDMRMNRLKCKAVLDSGSAKSYRKRLVVSEGDLYMVLRFRRDFGHPPECPVYKLTKHWTRTRWVWEKVEDLGERVFFINRDCSFSVSANDLPRPWKGNCVVLEKEGLPLCRCFQNDNEIEVFHFGIQLPRFSLLGMLQGFSDLFTPPFSILD